MSLGNPDMLSLTVAAGTDAESPSAVRRLLDEANTEFGYPRDARTFCAVLRDSSGVIDGGITALAYWGWLYVADIAVRSPWRGRGYGRALLAAAESWAVESDCHDAWLTTLSFQARGFYEHAGYEVFAALPNYPHEQTRLFLRKRLAQ